MREQLNIFRSVLKHEHLGAFIVPTTDAHNSEYVPEHWKCREWLSGFNGSAGTLVVSHTKAALWTDSRYFIAAQEQLEGSDIELMKDGLPTTPTIAEWLESVVFGENISSEVGLDGNNMSYNDVEALVQQLTQHGGMTLRTNFDPFDTAWTNRPAIPTNPIVIHPQQYAGTSASQKIANIRGYLKDHGCDGIIVSALDSVAWTLNLRGSDIEFNPVFVAFLLITKNEVTLFVDKQKIDVQVAQYLNEIGVETKNYDSIKTILNHYNYYNILIDASEVSYSLVKACTHTKVVFDASPLPMMKAVKNQTEIEGFKRAMARDGVALVRFLMWFEQALQTQELTEMIVAQKLEWFRAQQPLYKGLSFETISAYNANGAIVHYEPTPQTNATLAQKGFLLLDSGAQYLDGTTDITRTIALGTLTNAQKHVYTLVLKANIGLATTKFVEGACGTQLDIMARKPLWEEGMNFGHGTGHGVGSYLNVHEGPHQIRMQYRPAPIVEGMTVTNEPGLYLENEFGVRIENVLLTTLYMHSNFGRFVQFEDLTMCPIDTTPLKLNLLTQQEIEWINNYHQKVFNTLAPMLNQDEQQWLKNKTKAI